jgi:hypothetical protein
VMIQFVIDRSNLLALLLRSNSKSKGIVKFVTKRIHFKSRLL